MRLPLLVILAAFLLTACGQSEPPAKGEAGPPGPPGPPGPAGSGLAIRVITTPCNQPACGASCMENEQILNAYALDPGGAISFVDERNVTFQPKEKERPTVLVLACFEATKHKTATSPVAPEVSVEDRACIIPAAAKLPNLEPALKFERSRALPQTSAQGRRDPNVSNVKVKSTSAWPDRVQPMSLTASDKARFQPLGMR